MKFAKTPLSLFVTSTLLLTTSSLAIADEESGSKVEEVVVTASPILDSQTAAIEAKRNASNVMEVIAADTIGRFPDQNLADSLGRVPGMAIERDQGQARYVNFRGMPFRYTAIGFDGIDVPGAENGRIPRFDSFPSVITSRVEVNKAVLPSMPGEATAGFTNIRTFNPFDNEGFSTKLDVGLGEQSLGNGDMDKFGLRTSFSNSNIGVMTYYSKNSRDQITDNREYDLEPSGDSYVVNVLDMRSYKLTREDEAYGGSIEFRFDDANRIYLSKLYSKFIDYEQRNHYVFNFVGAPTGPVFSNEPMYVNRLLEDGEYNNSTDTTTLGMETEVDGWTVSAKYNFTKTEFNTFLPIVYQSGVNFLAGTPEIFLGSADVSNILDPIVTMSGMTPDEIVYGPQSTYGYKINWPMNVEADKFKVDLERDMSISGRPSTLSIGGELNHRDVAGANATVFAVTEFIGAFGGINLDWNSYLTDEPWYSNTTNSINATYWDNVAIRRDWEAAGGNLTPAAPEEDVTSIVEDIMAVYAMIDTEYDWGNIVYGVRIEETEYSSEGSLLNDETGALEPIYYEDSFVNVLPSLHINYNLSENLKARASVSTGVNRPTYIEWRASASINPTTTPKTVSGGNPSLKSEDATGVDLTLEYYFAPSSILAAGFFTKSIDNVIYSDVKEVDGYVYGGQEGENWEISGAVNGSDGKIYGLEFNFIGQGLDLHPNLNGWGISANVTFVDSEFTTLDGRKLGLPGTSDVVYNTSLIYENYGLSARLNYQYRDDWISPIEDPSEYWDELTRLDLNLQYQLPDFAGFGDASIYFNANNLTDETDVRYAGNGTVNQSESYGPGYLLGLRVSF